MSSTISVAFEDEVAIGDWQAFCSSNEIVYCPAVAFQSSYRSVGTSNVAIRLNGEGVAVHDERGILTDGIPPSSFRELSLSTLFMGDLKGVVDLYHKVAAAFDGVAADVAPEFAHLLDTVTDRHAPSH
jgi:hypothetical protein